ncbi:hypothetical protein [Polyangium aurulentum]|uniref:hypothetical protein n=1 Tax=Polyangium aurulentum TaxID=2567896 RepID=UPI0010ADF1DF|nr:hypothetical protein [Polyangium aurulentum]UQA62015.1 hypothetical protein E8A73_016685 [Polyangium aurulentum]
MTTPQQAPRRNAPPPKKPQQRQNPGPRRPAKPAAKPAQKPAPARPAQQARGNAPPAPVQQQKAVNSGAQQCPLKAQKPCDVQKLIVTATVLGDEVQVRKLETTKRLRNTPVPGFTDKSVLELLGTYDLVIDTIASYPSREDPHPKDQVKLEARADFHGRQCAHQQHPVMVLVPKTEARELPAGGIVKKGQALGPHQFFANSAGFDLGAPSGIAVIFDIVRSFWPLARPKKLEIRADACGIRAAGAAGPPVKYLAAVVRIFRKDTYAVGLKMPPLGKLTHERSGLITGVTERSRSTSMTGGFGHYQRTDSHKVSGEGALANYEASGSRWKGKKGEQHSHSRSVENGSVTRTAKSEYSDREGYEFQDVDGTQTAKMLEQLRKAQGFSFFIKRNDREFGKDIAPGEKKSLKQRIEDGVEAARKMVVGLRDLFMALPQLGFKFTFSVSLLEGSFAIEWGPNLAEDIRANGRYYPVDFKAVGKIAMDVVNISLDASFGVEAKRLGTGIVAKVGGTVGLKCSVEATISVDKRKPKMEIGLKPEAKCTLYATGEASVVGWSLINAHLTATAAIVMPDGKLEVSIKTGVKVTGTLRSEPILIKGYLKGPIGPPKRIDPPIQVLKGYPIYKFG